MGVVSGAATGASVGSVVPGIGTVAGGLIGGIGGLFSDEDEEAAKPPPPVQNAANNNPYFDYQYADWGGDPNAASRMHNAGFNMSTGFGKDQDWWNQQSQLNRGPQAFENQQLSNNEAMTRGYDQAGALQLAREAAMGQAPSEAAYQMQNGLNQSLAAQQAIQGSARGNAGIALAGGNAAAQTANLQNQTYGQAAQLRANEMAQARGMYGGLAGQVRDQDLSRLQQGSQMSQFNSTLNDNYRINSGTVGAQYGQLGIGAYNASMHPLDAQAGIQNGALDRTQQSYDRGLDRLSGVQTHQADMKAAEDKRKSDETQAYVGMGVHLAGQLIGSAAA